MATIDYYDSKTGQKKQLDLGPLASLDDLPQKIGVSGPESGAQRGKALYRWRGRTYVEGQLPADVQRVYDAYNGTGAGGVNLPTALPQTKTDAVINTAEQERLESKAANEARYKELLANIDQQVPLVDKQYDRYIQQLNKTRGNVESGYASALGLLDNYGQTATSDLARKYKSAGAVDSQSLIDRGLYNSTVLDSMKRRRSESQGREKLAIDESVNTAKTGLTERKTAALGDLDQQWANTTLNRLQTQQALQQAKRNIIEGRQDNGPDLSLIAQLVQQQEAAKQAKKGSGLGSKIFGSLLGGVSGGVSSGIGSLLGSLI